MPDGPEDADLAVAEVTFVQGDGRLHRGQRQELEEVALDHVLQGARRVVEAGPAHQRDRLVPDNMPNHWSAMHNPLTEA